MNVSLNFVFLAAGLWFAWLAFYFAPDMPAGLPVADRRFLHIVRGVKNFEIALARIHSLVTQTHITKSYRFVREQLMAPVTARSYRLVHQNVITIAGVKARVFIHKNSLHASNLPGIIYVHGSGWSGGSVLQHAPLLSEIVTRTQGKVKIIAIDYQLVPDRTFPTQFKECLRAVKHILQNPDQYDLDPKRIVLVGGNLAAAVTLRLRDEHFNGTSTLKSQILIHPVTNAINFLTKSYIQNDNVPLLSRANVIRNVLDFVELEYNLLTTSKMELNRHVGEDVKKTAAWKYLKEFQHPDADYTVTPSRRLIEQIDPELRNQYMFPMMAESLANLTRTYVLTCEHDVVRDDGIAFATRLRDEGTQVELNQLVCFHGAMHFFSHSVSGKIMLDQLLDWLNIELLL